jgi:DtxR family transcriptional regulator, Mn-dependent transcriptional regulator
MDLSAREDYLEAILICTLALNRSPAADEIASMLKNTPSIPEADLAYLEQSGDIVIKNDRTIELTQNGRIVAERVLKKHRVLQCFFREMLGMDDRTASDEACVLEHGVSDRTIERLGDYIDSSGEKITGIEPGIPKGLHIRERIRQTIEMGRHRPSPAGTVRDSAQGTPVPIRPTPGTGNGNSNQNRTRPLSDMHEKDRFLVTAILPGGDLHRLIDLGIFPGEEIWLRRKLRNNAVVIQVKGCDIALSPEIAATILVENQV